MPNPNLATIHAHHTALVLLGVGTTLGVVVQAALLVPSLLRSDLHLRFRWQPGHEAMRRITRLAGWTFGIVLSNQVALVVVLALADGAKVPGAVSAYTYAYTFFQLPYGVVAVSVMSAVTPSLSARWAEGDIAGFRQRMAFGLRSILAVVIPSAVGMIILAHPLIDLVLDHGAETSAEASQTAGALAMFALGLPGFCTFLYMVRVLQAMQDTRTAFRIYLVENAINIVLGVALVGPLGVRGLALSVSIAYTVAAVIALSVVARKDDGPRWPRADHPRHAGPGRHRRHGRGHRAGGQRVRRHLGLALLARVALAVVVGTLAFVGTTVVLASREERRTTAARRAPGPTPSPPPPSLRGHPVQLRHRGTPQPGRPVLHPARGPLGGPAPDPTPTTGRGRRRPTIFPRRSRYVADSATGPTGPPCATCARCPADRGIRRRAFRGVAGPSAVSRRTKRRAPRPRTTRRNPWPVSGW